MSQFSYYYATLKPEDLSARSLILSLISSIDSDRQSIAGLINAGALYGIEAATIRVAATRLLKDELLESPERGVYVPGPKARALTRRVQEWRDGASKAVDWNGDWLVALTHHLGRRDRKQLKTRERALALSGYREAEAGLWVRPANLARPLETHHHDVIALGADSALSILRVSQIASFEMQDWPRLWSPQELEASYTAAIDAMSTSLKRLKTLAPADAARESLLIGQAVIRAINFDPLLPPELGNQSLFRQMVSAMNTYNKAGQAAWRAYNASMNTPRPAG